MGDFNISGAVPTSYHPISTVLLNRLNFCKINTLEVNKSSKLRNRSALRVDDRQEKGSRPACVELRRSARLNERKLTFLS